MGALELFHVRHLKDSTREGIRTLRGATSAAEVQHQGRLSSRVNAFR